MSCRFSVPFNQRTWNIMNEPLLNRKGSNKVQVLVSLFRTIARTVLHLVTLELSWNENWVWNILIKEFYRSKMKRKGKRLHRQRGEDWDCFIPPPSFSFHSPISSHNDRWPGADITTCRQCVIMLAFHFRPSTVSWKPCLSLTVSTTGWTLSHCIVERKVAKMTTMITELLENSRYGWLIFFRFLIIRHCKAQGFSLLQYQKVSNPKCPSAIDFDISWCYLLFLE